MFGATKAHGINPMARTVKTSDVLVHMIHAAGYKRVSLSYYLSGTKALIRTPDGQGYEVSVKPASLSRFEPFNKFTQKKTKKR